MIDYDPHECFGMGILFRLAGSVIPRNITTAFAGVVVTTSVGVIRGDNAEPLSYSAYGERVTCTVLGLLLVFRCSFALARFWESTGFLTRVISYLADVARDAKAFSIKDPSRPAPEAILFQNKVSRLLRLLLCVMFQNLTGKVELTAWGAHEYLEESEKPMLRLDVRTRPGVVSVWILEEFMNLHHSKLLAVPPPALNNPIRAMSDANMFYHKALKIADTQFPFPMVQMSRILLFFFLFVTPVVFGNNPGPLWQNVLLTFIVMISFFCADSIAAELSDPFGDDDNDLPLLKWLDGLKRLLSDVLPNQDPHAPDLPPMPDEFGIREQGDTGKKPLPPATPTMGGLNPLAAMGGIPSMGTLPTMGTALPGLGMEGSLPGLGMGEYFEGERMGLLDSDAQAWDQGGGWYDMSTGMTYSYKANENCVPDDSGLAFAPEPESVYDGGLPPSDVGRRGEWYDMSTGLYHDTKVNANCVRDDSGQGFAPHLDGHVQG